MAYDFYWISGSPNAWRVMLALEHKQIAYHSHRLDAGKREHKSASFLALNPLGKVPLLKHGHTVLTESIAIMAYLERAHPEHPLFGTSAAATGLVWQRIFEFVNGLRDLIDDGVIRPLSQGLEGDGASGAQAAAAVHTALSDMESTLTKSDCLAGDSLSAADFSVIPNIAMLMRYGDRPQALERNLQFDQVRRRYPAIGRWLDRLESSVAYQASYPPHWRQG